MTAPGSGPEAAAADAAERGGGMRAEEVAAALGRGAVVIDTRPLEAFAAGHLPGALHVAFNLADLTERAALWLPCGLTAVVHAEPESTVEASVGLLADAGLDVRGHLEGGLAAWQAAARPVEPLACIDVEELAAHRARYEVLDVRERYEFAHGHLAGAHWRPAPEVLAAGAEALPRGRPWAVFCSGTGRAAFAASALARHGLPVVLVLGGMYEWQRRGYPVVPGM
jgi:hydroxyacylglutathione hydrolase